MILDHTNAFLFLMIWKQYFPSFKNITGPYTSASTRLPVQKHSWNIREEQRKKIQGR